MNMAKVKKRVRKGEWGVQFQLKLRTDLGYNCAHLRGEIKKRWPTACGVLVRRIM
jgi:hypothetical protein